MLTDTAVVIFIIITIASPWRLLPPLGLYLARVRPANGAWAAWVPPDSVSDGALSLPAAPLRLVIFKGNPSHPLFPLIPCDIQRESLSSIPPCARKDTLSPVRPDYH